MFMDSKKNHQDSPVNHRAPWTDWERAFVGEHANTLSTAEIASILGRTEAAVRQVKVEFRRAEARRVLEQYGMTLPPGHCCHHINGNPNDNSIQNLLIVDVRRHASIHYSLQALLPELYAKGYIVFRDGKYQVV